MINNCLLKENKRFVEAEYFNEALFESLNFKVIPSLGSLVEGWLLVLPKKHYISFGAINNEDLYTELEGLLNHVCKIIENEYGNFIIFEHGPVAPQTVIGCGVDYAHLHIVPIEIDLIQKSSKYIALNKWIKIPSIGYTKSYFNSGLPYLLVQDNKQNLFIGTDENIPSQLFRKVIAEHIGMPDKYDWKQYSFAENINKTICKFSPNKKNILITKRLQHG